MFSVYVLYSERFSKIYIGYTSDLIARLESHNTLATKGYTLKFRPWKMVYVEEYSTKQETTKREKELKSAKGRQFVWDVINNATKS